MLESLIVVMDRGGWHEPCTDDAMLCWLSESVRNEEYAHSGPLGAALRHDVQLLPTGMISTQDARRTINGFAWSACFRRWMVHSTTPYAIHAQYLSTMIDGVRQRVADEAVRLLDELGGRTRAWFQATRESWQTEARRELDARISEGVATPMVITSRAQRMAVAAAVAPAAVFTLGLQGPSFHSGASSDGESSDPGYRVGPQVLTLRVRGRPRSSRRGRPSPRCRATRLALGYPWRRLRPVLSGSLALFHRLKAPPDRQHFQRNLVVRRRAQYRPRGRPAARAWRLVIRRYIAVRVARLAVGRGT